MLSPEEQYILLDIARSSLESYVRSQEILSLDSKSFPETLDRQAGAFVTLRIKEKLRGCMGRFQTTDPLCKVIRDMAISAATRDNRFRQVTAGELDDIIIELSVLSEQVRIQDISEIELGRHGIYIKKGMNSGTFLPDVAESTGWDLEQFLGHCARDKAHIGWNGWKEADIYIYETESFGEDDFRFTQP